MCTYIILALFQLRNQAETELRALRAELTQKKMNMNLSRTQKMNSLGNSVSQSSGNLSARGPPPIASNWALLTSIPSIIVYHNILLSDIYMTLCIILYFIHQCLPVVTLLVIKHFMQRGSLTAMSYWLLNELHLVGIV